MSQMRSIIFTDGSSRGNPGPGGWGVVIVSSKDDNWNFDAKNKDTIQVVELGGRETTTTNNRMELTASIEGLTQVEVGSDVTVYSDSSYVINGITKWIHGWQKNDWRTKTKDEVLNKDLWLKLYNETTNRTVHWKYVGGHIGIVGNERCDQIATAYADNISIDLYKGRLADYDLPQILDISHDSKKLVSKKSNSARARTKPISYVSCVGDSVKVHQTWAECERRVKGVKGARFKKALDLDEQNEIVSQWTPRKK